MNEFFRTNARIALSAGLLLSACGGSSEAPNVPASASGEARYFFETVTSFDGTPIAVTAFVPALAPGQTAPLILHSNGWGDTRTQQPTDLTYDPNNFYGDMHHGMVTRMWRAGYVVISMDNRGWGDSGGQARIMDPDREIRDYSAVINWAEANLPVAKRDGRAVVGAVGGSYGGGFQMPLAKQDARIKAVSPWVTWHDLRYSLAPDEVVRSGHVTLLNIAGLVLARMDPFIPRAYTQALVTNRPPADVLVTLANHSPVTACGNGTQRPVDALIVQGTRDTLFDLLEGWQNAECLRAGGADARLLAVPNGHLFNIQNVQAPPTSSLCGPVDPFESTVAWYDEKLKGMHGAASRIPRVCLPLSDTEALILDEMPMGGLPLAIPETTVLWQPGNVYNDGMQYVPLKTVTGERALAGIPRLRLRLESPLPTDEDIVFVGVAVQRADGGRELVSDQIRPLRGTGVREMLLPGISTMLAPGDELGLAIYTSHGQYELHSSRMPFVLTLAGTLELPLHD